MVGSITIGSNDRLYRIYVLWAFGLGSIGFVGYVSLGSETYRFRRVRFFSHLVSRDWHLACIGLGYPRSPECVGVGGVRSE